jgi:hypothetical protein
VHDRIVWGFQLLHIYYHNWIMLIWMAPCYLEDIANGDHKKTEKSAILSETELEFFYYKHSWKSISFQNNWGKEESYLYFGGTAYLGMPANPEFQELIIKKHTLGLRLRKFPKCKYTAYGIWKGEEFLRNYICSCYSYCFIRDACRKISDWRTHPLYRCFLSLS